MRVYVAHTSSAAPPPSATAWIADAYRPRSTPSFASASTAPSGSTTSPAPRCAAASARSSSRATGFAALAERHAWIAVA